MFAEKDLSWKNDRERHNSHHSKSERHQPYPASPTQEDYRCGSCRARAEKPATQNDENEQQHHGAYNPYRHGLIEREHMIKNKKGEHNDGKKGTGLPRHCVAKKTSGELHKPGAGARTTAMKVSHGTITSQVASSSG